MPILLSNHISFIKCVARIWMQGKLRLFVKQWRKRRGPKFSRYICLVCISNLTASHTSPTTFSGNLFTTSFPWLFYWKSSYCSTFYNLFTDLTRNYYLAECTVQKEVICLGRRTFHKQVVWYFDILSGYIYFTETTFLVTIDRPSAIGPQDTNGQRH